MASPPHLARAVEAAQQGDLGAFVTVVQATQNMAYAVAWQVLRREQDARDVVQEAYLRAFKRLAELSQPDAFVGWLRRIVITLAQNHRRRARAIWLPLDDLAAPVLDDDEHGRKDNDACWRGLCSRFPERIARSASSITTAVIALRV